MIAKPTPNLSQGEEGGLTPAQWQHIFTEAAEMGINFSLLAGGEPMMRKDILEERRQEFEDIIFLSFPGDEKALGGCLASGRGFFHIGPDGSAEPCPFSPFSDSNVVELGVRGAII